MMVCVSIPTNFPHWVSNGSGSDSSSHRRTNSMGEWNVSWQQMKPHPADRAVELKIEKIPAADENGEIDDALVETGASLSKLI